MKELIELFESLLNESSKYTDVLSKVIDFVQSNDSPPSNAKYVVLNVLNHEKEGQIIFQGFLKEFQIYLQKKGDSENEG